MSARTREMLGLIPVALIVSAGFGAVILARSEGGPPGAALDEVKAGTLTYGLVFLGLCLFAHLFMRARLPDADPYLFPLAATLAAFGLVVIYRIDPELAREQAQWFVIGLVVFVATIVFLRDHAVLERYRYTIAAAGIALLLMPRVPGLGEQVNGAFLNVKLGPISVPARGVRQDRDHHLPGQLPPGHRGRAGALAPDPADRVAAGAVDRPAGRVRAAVRAGAGAAARPRASCWPSSWPRWRRSCASGRRSSTSARCCWCGGWPCSCCCSSATWAAR